MEAILISASTADVSRCSVGWKKRLLEEDEIRLLEVDNDTDDTLLSDDCEGDDERKVLGVDTPELAPLVFGAEALELEDAICVAR